MLQHYGTHKIGFMFAPIIIIWLLFVSGVGIYNIFNWNKQIIHAISPVYMYRFVRNIDIDSWRSLGSIILCLAGQSLNYILILLIINIYIYIFAGFLLSPMALVASQDAVLLQDQKPCLQV
jgi:K+ transporter